MTELSTLAGQHSHYSAVRERLYGPAAVRRATPKPAPAKPPRDVIQVSSSAPVVPVAVAAIVELPARAPTWRRILYEVAQKHGITPRDILGSSRYKPVVLARREVIWRMRQELKFSFPRIAMYLGRDHTTILYNHAQHVAQMEQGE